MSATLIKYPAVELTADMYSAKLNPEIIPIGSYHAFGVGKDKDYVLLFPKEDVWDDVMLALEDVGYVRSSPEEYPYADNTFECFRKGDNNIMVTWCMDFAENSRKAFDVVRILNLKDKGDRIIVHKIIVDGAMYAG